MWCGKRSEFESILKIELARFVNRLDRTSERKRPMRVDSRVFHWGILCEEEALEGKIRILFLGMSCLR